MTKQNKYFEVDPYPYKSTDENRSKEDSEFLQKLLNKTECEIKQTSNAYHGNNDGLRSFIFVTRSYENLRRIELSGEATSLAVAIIIFAIEGIMSHVKKRKKSAMSPSESRVIKYFLNCIDRDSKLILLNSLVFSWKASKSIPMGRNTVRHLMYRGMLKESDDNMREYTKTEWCSCQESLDNIHCGCIKWLSSQNINVVNHYLKLLSTHLYKMRCAIVHDGIAPLISHTEEKPSKVAIWGMTVSDVYFNHKNSRHYEYESALSRKRLEGIFISSLWEAYKLGYPRKKL